MGLFDELKEKNEVSKKEPNNKSLFDQLQEKDLNSANKDTTSHSEDNYLISLLLAILSPFLGSLLIVLLFYIFFKNDKNYLSIFLLSIMSISSVIFYKLFTLIFKGFKSDQGFDRSMLSAAYILSVIAFFVIFFFVNYSSIMYYVFSISLIIGGIVCYFMFEDNHKCPNCKKYQGKKNITSDLVDEKSFTSQESYTKIIYDRYGNYAGSIDDVQNVERTAYRFNVKYKCYFCGQVWEGHETKIV